MGEEGRILIGGVGTEEELRLRGTTEVGCGPLLDTIQ